LANVASQVIVCVTYLQREARLNIKRAIFASVLPVNYLLRIQVWVAEKKENIEGGTSLTELGSKYSTFNHFKSRRSAPFTFSSSLPVLRKIPMPQYLL
jgi:hypothetical protein